MYSISSFFTLFVPSVAFLFSLIKVRQVFQSLGGNYASTTINTSWIMMLGIIILQILNFLFVGQFIGFSIFFILSIVLALVSLFFVPFELKISKERP